MLPIPCIQLQHFFSKESAEKFSVTFIDASKPENYANAACKNTKIFWIETPSNPLLKITDLSGVAQIAHQKGIFTIVDNTFATPFNQKPLNFGIDLVIHSATKYLGGHSDLTAGLVAGKKSLRDPIRFHAIKLYGASIAPEVAWLALRGIKTLALRMERQNYNAFTIAQRLSEHPKVKTVYYPGLPSHENHEIARKQMSGFGGVVSFDMGSVEAGKKLVDNVRLCILATSLGGVETATFRFNDSCFAFTTRTHESQHNRRAYTFVSRNRRRDRFNFRTLEKC